MILEEDSTMPEDKTNPGAAADGDVQIQITGDELAGFEAKLPTGQVYKGKTQTELLNAVVKAQLNSSMTIQQKETQLAETRAALEQERRERQQQQTRTRQNRNDGDEPVFDKAEFNKKYWELINSDPLAAIEYANS